MGHVAYGKRSWTFRQPPYTAARRTIHGAMVKRMVDDNYRLPTPKAGTIASRIRAAMLAAGIKTTHELSLKTKGHKVRPKGISRQTIHNWLQKSANSIDPKLLFVVADTLSVAPRWLAIGGDTMMPPRHLSPDEAHVLELLALLEGLADGSKDLWIKDGVGRIETAKVRAAKAPPRTTPLK